MFWEKHKELIEAGHAFALVILTDAAGSAPQDAGAKMLCDENGLILGTVGGGKVEALALKTAATLLHEKKSNAFVEWHLQKDVGMTCGGKVKLYFETFNATDWHIVIFGAGHVAQALVRVLLSLECRITCVDGRPQWLSQLADSHRLKKIQTETPASLVAKLPNQSYLLLMTQGHATDMPVLLEALRHEPGFPYVGVIGSKSKRAVLKRELIASGLPEILSDTFFCPIGLPLGKSTPAEIAVSVTAQLLQIRDEHSRTKNSI